MSEHDDHRARSLVMRREVMQAEPPPVSDQYTELTTDHLMGVIWTCPGLARRDRRLVTLTIAAVAGQCDPLRNHLRASLESGDLSLAELHEWIIHLAHCGGWPAGTTAYALLAELSRGATAASAATQRGPSDARTPQGLAGACGTGDGYGCAPRVPRERGPRPPV
jgi:alkylhydroperoxidase/carboxymuconolactone decarboxylase family protein YurZ